MELPSDIVDDIFRRVHKLRMVDLRMQLNNHQKMLTSYQALAFEDWIDLVEDDLFAQFFICRLVAKVIYASNTYLVGQTIHKSWFFYNIQESSCIVADDIKKFLEDLPKEIKEDIF